MHPPRLKKKIHLQSYLSLKILFNWRKTQRYIPLKNAYKSSMLLVVIFLFTKRKSFQLELITLFFHSLCDPSSFLCQFLTTPLRSLLLLCILCNSEFVASYSQSFLGHLPCSSVPWPRIFAPVGRVDVGSSLLLCSGWRLLQSFSSKQRWETITEANLPAIITRRDRILPGHLLITCLIFFLKF